MSGRILQSKRVQGVVGGSDRIKYSPHNFSLWMGYEIELTGVKKEEK